MTLATSHHLHPPFPKDVKTAPLVSISLVKLETEAGDNAESKAFFKASKELGFFYLNMEGSALGEKIVAEAEELNRVQQGFSELPDEEKDQFAREKLDAFFGYRILHERNDSGITKRDEDYNVSYLLQLLSKLLIHPYLRKDDLVGNCAPLPCPDLISKH